jgi:hypothetical protein
MKDRTILAALIQSREAYDTISTYHDDTDFSDMGELIYKEIDKYYQRDSDATCISKQSLLRRLGRAYPRQLDKFEAFISGLSDVSVGNIVDDYRDMKADSLGELIGGHLLAGEHKKATPLLEKYNALQAEGLAEGDVDSPKVYIDSDVSDFGDSLKAENRIPIAPSELNDAFDGGLIRGSHTLIYAPPECGKTATAINLAYSTACTKRSRPGCKTLYIGNEESDDMYLNRMLCRFTQWTREEVEADPEGAMAVARQRGWANLIFVHMSPGSIPQVQKLILEHMPDVVIIDQLANLLLGQGKEPEKTQLLERNAYAMRMFYSKHKIAGVSMSQADEKAIGKLHLTIKDVYYSNIGVQGQVDAMIGIGMNDSYAASNRRVLNITKNKLGGKHTHIVVQLYPEISALKSIG